MNRNVVVILAAGFVLTTAAPLFAQAPQSPQPQNRQAPPAASPSSPAAPAPPGSGGGMMPMAMCHEMMHGMMHGGGMHGGGMMGGGMMGGGMGGGMMGMPMMGGGGPMDPKTMGAMLEMRAEMMKAVADVMLKHARRLQQPAGK